MEKKTIITILVILVLVVAAAILVRPKSANRVPINQAPISSAEGEAAVRSVVNDFGLQLKQVALLAPSSDVTAAMDAHYAPYVSPSLLDTWERDPSLAPGKETSSPYPARIDITSVIQLSNTNYKVEGDVIELTSEEETHGGVASQYHAIFTVDNIGGEWRITSYSHSAQE